MCQSCQHASILSTWLYSDCAHMPVWSQFLKESQDVRKISHLEGSLRRDWGVCAGAVWSAQRGGSGVPGAAEDCTGTAVWQLPVPAAQGLPSAHAGQPDDLLWCAWLKITAPQTVSFRASCAPGLVLNEADAQLDWKPGDANAGIVSCLSLANSQSIETSPTLMNKEIWVREADDPPADVFSPSMLLTSHCLCSAQALSWRPAVAGRRESVAQR